MAGVGFGSDVHGAGGASPIEASTSTSKAAKATPFSGSADLSRSKVMEQQRPRSVSSALSRDEFLKLDYKVKVLNLKSALANLGKAAVGVAGTVVAAGGGARLPVGLSMTSPEHHNVFKDFAREKLGKEPTPFEVGQIKLRYQEAIARQPLETISDPSIMKTKLGNIKDRGVELRNQLIKLEGGNISPQAGVSYTDLGDKLKKALLNINMIEQSKDDKLGEAEKRGAIIESTMREVEGLIKKAFPNIENDLKTADKNIGVAKQTEADIRKMKQLDAMSMRDMPDDAVQKKFKRLGTKVSDLFANVNVLKEAGVKIDDKIVAQLEEARRKVGKYSGDLDKPEKIGNKIDDVKKAKNAGVKIEECLTEAQRLIEKSWGSMHAFEKKVDAERPPPPPPEDA
jgi:hypothetical protein